MRQAREMVIGLKALLALPEEPSLVPSTQVNSLQLPDIPVPDNLVAVIWSLWASIYAHITHIYTHTQR